MHFVFVIPVTVLSNLALRKPANQSSTLWIHTAEYAVDGNYGTDITQDQCTHTDTDDMNPWWMVDLQTVFHYIYQNSQQRTGLLQKCTVIVLNFNFTYMYVHHSGFFFLKHISSLRRLCIVKPIFFLDLTQCNF